MKAISTTALTKIYFDKKHGKALLGLNHKMAVDYIEVQINTSEFVAIMGKSGSGKSTLLRLMGGIDKPSSGQVQIAGKDISRYNNAQLSQLRHEQIGFVFQEFCLIDTLTVLENIMLPLLLNKVAPSTAKNIAKKNADHLGLSEILNKSPLEISGGEKQRVAICRAIACKPAILLADEPTGNLDTENTKNVIEMMRTINQEQGYTILVVTHDPYIASYCNRVLYLQDGRVKSDIRKESEATDTEFLSRLLNELYC